MTLLVLKILIVVGVVGTLHTFKRFRNMSRDLDEAAVASVKRIMHAAQESGCPPEMVPLLMVLMTLAFIYVTAATRVFGP